MTDDQKAARERVSKYLAERVKIRGIDQNEISALHVGDEREAVLKPADLCTILSALDTATAERDALAARVAVLEGQGEPVGWGVRDFCGDWIFYEDKDQAEHAFVVMNSSAPILPLYEHSTPEALARAERAEAALKPLADLSPAYGPETADDVFLTQRPWPIRLTVGHARAAAAALSPSPATQTGE